MISEIMEKINIALYSPQIYRIPIFVHYIFRPPLDIKGIKLSPSKMFSCTFHYSAN